MVFLWMLFMEIDAYKLLIGKKPIKKRTRTKPLPKAKEKYLETKETLFQEL